MRHNWLSNRIFKSFDDIVDHCCYAWKRAHRSAVENHVHRPPRLGSRRSLNLRISISQRDIEGLARWYEDRADAQRQSGCEVDQAKVDARLQSETDLPSEPALDAVAKACEIDCTEMSQRRKVALHYGVDLSRFLPSC
jgi:hypothetical protein